MSEVRQSVSGSLGKYVRAPKVAELVATQLRRSIITGELAEGDSLPSEAALVRQFGVSRPTLREAFRVLESESLIAVRRGAHGGGTVLAPDRAVAARYAGLILQCGGVELADVYAARVELEAPCAAVLARSHTDADIAALREAVTRAESPDSDIAESVRAHTEFHGLLVRLAGNQTMTMLSELLEHIIAEANLSTVDAKRGSVEADKVIHRTADVHRRVVGLIAKGDAERAQRLWRRHLIDSEDYVLFGQEGKSVVDLLL
ncbi:MULTISPECIES: FadR/GntR family transcriptional regulator [Nocardia]|uniref:FadR/GntR family transcriptional regulator n=1 Tax=Nocardia TaxID=1817 RepID=UPI000D69C42D|nr:MULTISPECIES: FCD domain-containing protein [Nocardia]